MATRYKAVERPSASLILDAELRGNRAPVFNRQGTGGAAFFGTSAEPRQLEGLKLANEGGLEASWLDAFHGENRIGRIIVDNQHKLLWASGCAMRLLEPRVPLALQHGRLVGAGKCNDDRLRSLVSDASQRKVRVEGLFAPAAGERPSMFVLAKLCSATNGVAIQIRDLRGHVEGIPDLMTLYGLTPTEHQIVSLLLNGLSVSDVAEQLHNSVLTVRTHVKRAYSKLDINSKEQLFSMVLKLMVA